MDFLRAFAKSAGHFRTPSVSRVNANGCALIWATVVQVRRCGIPVDPSGCLWSM